MEFAIKHRFTGAIVFTAKLECSEDASYSLQMGLAVKAALAAKANLSEANLRYIKHDVPALRQAIIDGKVDGSTYSGACACLCGTIANVRGCDVEDTKEMAGITPDSYSMAERFFMGIKKGDTPETNGASKVVLGWVDEFLAIIAKHDALVGGSAR